MKLQVLLILVTLSLVLAKFELRDKEDALKAHEECREDNYVPDDIYEKFLNYEFPEHKHTKCYMKCWVEKMDLFTEKRGFIENNIIYQFSHMNYHLLGSVRHGLEKCIDHNEAESDVCTFVERVFSCWLKVNRHTIRQVLGSAQ